MTIDQPQLDAVELSLWRPLFRLLASINNEIAAVYTGTDFEGINPGKTMVVIRLASQGAMTITELANSLQVTHSAASQKVTALRTGGFVRTVAGSDARTKKVMLTAKGKRIAAALEAEWLATETTLAQIESEIPRPLSVVVSDIEKVLAGKSFRQRLAEKLEHDPDWP